MPAIVYKLLKIQLIVALLGALLSLVLLNWQGMLAAFGGGLIAMLATALSAVVTFQGGPGRSPEASFWALLKGEFFKFVVVIAALATSFTLFPAQAVPLLATMAVALLSTRFAMLRSDSRDFTPR